MQRLMVTVWMMIIIMEFQLDKYFGTTSFAFSSVLNTVKMFLVA